MWKQERKKILPRSRISKAPANGIDFSNKLLACWSFFSRVKFEIITNNAKNFNNKLCQIDRLQMCDRRLCRKQGNNNNQGLISCIGSGIQKLHILWGKHEKDRLQDWNISVDLRNKQPEPATLSTRHLEFTKLIFKKYSNIFKYIMSWWEVKFICCFPEYNVKFKW